MCGLGGNVDVLGIQSLDHMSNQVILVPASADDEDLTEVRHTSQDDRAEPLHCLLTDSLRLSLDHVLDRVINDGEVRTESSHGRATTSC